MRRRVRFHKLILLAILVLGIMTFAACGSKDNQGDASDKVSIVTTGFPEYDWTRALLGNLADDVDLKMLLADGIDMHSFQPSAQDVVDIAEADMVVYGGGESEEWIVEILEETDNKNRIVINLMEESGVATLDEEEIEGMQSNHNHDHASEATHEADEHDSDHASEATHDEDNHDSSHTSEGTHEADEHDSSHDSDHDHASTIEQDEHIWLSPKNAIRCCGTIAEELELLLPGGKDEIEKNYRSYVKSLEGLDAELEDVVAHGRQDTLVFCDRFPFRYLTEDYGIEYFAAFPGCSTESDASFDTILFLADKVKETHARAVVVLEGSNQDIANTVIETAGDDTVAIVELNSMQAVKKQAADEGLTYLNIMQKNIDAIRFALDAE